jgi:hypothetical protein
MNPTQAASRAVRTTARLTYGNGLEKLPALYAVQK